jgi:hypothetical protein
MSQNVAAGAGGMEQVTDPSGSRLSYPKWSLRPASVHCHDGVYVEFNYDDLGRTSMVRERNGITWTRASDPDHDGFAVWKSDDGQVEEIAYEVMPCGGYQRRERGAVLKTVYPSGKCYYGYAFTAGFDLRATAQAVFTYADNNVDRTITRMELERAGEHRWTTVNEALLAQVLRLSFEHLIELRENPTMREAGGLVLEEILKYDALNQASLAQLAVSGAYHEQLFDNLFDALDTNNDSMLCLDEAFALAKDGKLSPEQRVLVELISDFARSVTSYEEFGFSELADLIYKTEFKSLSLKALHKYAERLLVRGCWLVEERISKVWRPMNLLYASAGNPVESVVVDAIEQGPLGNNVFQAALAGLAHSHPPSIVGMIKENQSGSCTVVFPGDPGDPVVLEVPGNLEASLRVRSPKFGVWPALLDKAYVLWKLKKTLAGGQDKGSAGEPAAMHDPVLLLSGRAGKWCDLPSMKIDDLKAKLADNFRQRRIVICSIATAEAMTADRFVDSAVYAVVRYNKDTGEVILRSASWRAGASGAGTGGSSASSPATSEIVNLTIPAADLISKFKSIYLGE